MLHHSHSGAGAGSAKSNWASVKPWTSARYHGPISSQPGNRVRAETVESVEAGIGDLLQRETFSRNPPVCSTSGAHLLSLSRFMVHEASEARRPPRWLVDRARACSPARPRAWLSSV